MDGILITNNPLMNAEAPVGIQLIYLENADFIDVLYFVRDKIHAGHRLLTHPLAGSVKPDQTPYKSVIMTKSRVALESDSLEIIEDSIAMASKLIRGKRPSARSKDILKDLQIIDKDLIMRR